MARHLVAAVRVAAVTLVLTGIVYPLAMTGAARVLYPGRAGGSIVADARGRVVGSELLGQRLTHPGYFHARPSAAGFDACSSGGSNLGPTSRKLRARVEAELASLRAANPGARAEVPAELVTASGSGLDPHVGMDAARWQAPRVAEARGVGRARIDAVIDAVAEGRSLGILGEPRVNVLLLNLALDRRFGTPSGTGPARSPTAPGAP